MYYSACVTQQIVHETSMNHTVYPFMVTLNKFLFHLHHSSYKQSLGSLCFLSLIMLHDALLLINRKPQTAQKPLRLFFEKLFFFVLF